MSIFRNVQLPDDDTLVRAATETLTHPPDSWFGDPELFVTWGLTIGRHRDSGLLEVSNFERVTEDMHRTFPADTGTTTASDWGTRWREELRVRVLEPWADPDNWTVRDITRAFAVIVSVATQLREQYPIYDDRDLSAREAEADQENQDEAWANTKHKLWLEYDVEDEDVTDADRTVFDAAWQESRDIYGYSEARVSDRHAASQIMLARFDGNEEAFEAYLCARGEES